MLNKCLLCDITTNYYYNFSFLELTVCKDLRLLNMGLCNLKPSALGSALTLSGSTAQGLQVVNSVDPCILKSNY